METPRRTYCDVEEEQEGGNETKKVRGNEKRRDGTYADKVEWSMKMNRVRERG